MSVKPNLGLVTYCSICIGMPLEKSINMTRSQILSKRENKFFDINIHFGSSLFLSGAVTIGKVPR